MALRPLFLIVTTYAALVLVGYSTDTDVAQEHSTPAFPSSNGTYLVKTSFCGQEVVVKHEPQRIIGVGRKDVANIIFASVADKMVVRFGKYGAQYSPRIRSGLNGLTDIEEIVFAGGEERGSISFECILELRPDMAYGSALGDGDLSIDSLETNGILAMMPPSSCAYAFTNVTSNFADLDAIPAHVREFGAFLNTAEKADMDMSIMEADLAKARAGGKKFPKLTVASLYYWDSSEDLFAYDANLMIQGIFDATHLKNVVAPTYDTMLNGATSPEAIVKSNSDVLIVTTGEGGITPEDSLARLEKIPGVTETATLKNKRIIELPSGATYPTVEAVDAARELAKTLTEQ